MRVIIIGAGPAGLAAALRLKAALNAEVVVYEIRSKPTTIGGAIQLPPNGLRLMDHLGLCHQLNSRGFRSSRIQMHSMQGDVLSDVDRSEAGGDKSGFGYMRILRRDLLDVLHNAARIQGVPVHFGKHLVQIMEEGDVVKVTFSDGHSDSGDLLLGCDGIHSAVRRLHVDPTAEPTYSGVANLFAIVSTSDLEPTNCDISPGLHGTMTPHGLLALSPCNASAEQLYWFFSRGVDIPDGDSREGWEAKGKDEVNAFKDKLLEVLRDATGSWNDQFRDIIRKTNVMNFYPIFKMPPDSKWYSKRSILLGDAAHAMPPHAGQGTSMALEDVFCLSRLLETPGFSLAEVFEHYERIRRPRVETIAQTAAERGQERVVSKNPGPQPVQVAVGMKTAGSQKLGSENYHNAIAYDIMDEPLPVSQMLQGSLA